MNEINILYVKTIHFALTTYLHKLFFIFLHKLVFKFNQNHSLPNLGINHDYKRSKHNFEGGITKNLYLLIFSLLILTTVWHKIEIAGEKEISVKLKMIE